MSQTERELHADFFTQWGDEARAEIADMGDEQLTEWRNKIAKIALEAKVKATVGDEVLRQRKAKKLAEGKPWLVPSEIDKTIKEVRQGKTRLSRTEKLAELMNGLIGVKGSEEIINKIKTTTSDSKVIKMINEDKKSTVEDSVVDFGLLKLED